MKTIQDIHDAVSLGLRNLGLNIFGVLDEYVIDNHLNTVADNIINTLYSIALDKTDALTSEQQLKLRDYTSRLSRFISSFSIETFSFNPLTDRYEIEPVSYFNPNDTVKLYQGIEYVVHTFGNSDLTPYGGRNITKAGDRFVCTLKPIKLSSLVVGTMYRIVSVSNTFDFTTIGAPGNYGIGTIFVSTSLPTAGSYTNDDVLQPLNVSIPGGTTVLKHCSDNSYSGYISSSLLASFAYDVTGGVLPANRYFVNITNSDDIPNIKYILKETPVETNNTYKQLKIYPVMLRTIEDINANVGSYGKRSLTPSIVLSDNKLALYVNPNIRPFRLSVMFLRKRVSFNYYNPYVVDWDEKYISELVRATVEYIAAVNNNPNLNNLKQTQ